MIAAIGDGVVGGGDREVHDHVDLGVLEHLVGRHGLDAVGVGLLLARRPARCRRRLGPRGP